MPPRLGTLDLKSFAKGVQEIQGYKTDAWLLKGAQILHLNHEIDDLPGDNLLPRTMHPSIPAYAIFNVAVYPDSPVSKFAIAEVRIAGRAGVRPRAFVLRSVVNSEAAARELSRRWGYPTTLGDVSITVRHDRVIGRVAADGRTILEMELLDRDLISGADIQYIASMHLARNSEDGKLVLVQLDPEYVFARAERGRPRVIMLDHDAWGTKAYMKLTNPIAASFATCDVTLPRIRYICDPEKPAFQGTTRLAA